MKLSIIVPVYYNADTLELMYSDLKRKVLDVLDFEYELIFVNDGSKDDSLLVLKKLKKQDSQIKVYSLSRDFGSQSAILWELEHMTGDCAVVKAADMQEPSELILDMVASWKKGNNVVLAVREERDEVFLRNFLPICIICQYTSTQNGFV